MAYAAGTVSLTPRGVSGRRPAAFCGFGSFVGHFITFDRI